ncbi:hypothetical protein B0H17DRAFT_1202458 [Mycena rosella]|uniref:Uncharacterized protein n=1 Tax=Mycena rosella TaxID=1033263 RepID=A0AAD7DEB9_MYCRO|nr:hypothetical protein B0H17DRAFT_1202458 [Mycena rosella]
MLAATPRSLQAPATARIFLPMFASLCALYALLAARFDIARQTAHWPTPAARSSAPTLSAILPVVRAQAYLSADLLVGALTGWIHPAVYLGIADIAIRSGWAHTYVCDYRGALLLPFRAHPFFAYLLRLPIPTTLPHSLPFPSSPLSSSPTPPTPISRSIAVGAQLRSGSTSGAVYTVAHAPASVSLRLPPSLHSVRRISLRTTLLPRPQRGPPWAASAPFPFLLALTLTLPFSFLSPSALCSLPSSSSHPSSPSLPARAARALPARGCGGVASRACSRTATNGTAQALLCPCPAPAMRRRRTMADSDGDAGRSATRFGLAAHGHDAASALPAPCPRLIAVRSCGRGHGALRCAPSPIRAYNPRGTVPLPLRSPRLLAQRLRPHQ